MPKELKKGVELINHGFMISACCKAKIKLNPVEWSSPFHVKTWQPWCLKCETICFIEKVEN